MSDRFTLIKRHSRLRIVDGETGAEVYSPPDFIRVVSRSDFTEFLEELNAGRRLIDAIMAFERHARIAPGYHDHSRFLAKA